MSIDNVNIINGTEMITPEELKNKYKASENVVKHIEQSRETVSNIVNLKDDRLLTIVGPCSIHDTKEALEYAKSLAELKDKYPNLFIVMRTYFEKPRTTIGWKGLINDPDLNGSFNIEKGLEKAREFLLKVNELGLPAATEFLDNMTPADLADLISWGAIGARTTESQLHREMSSGMSMPIGFKNATNGDSDIALDAIVSSNNPHSFIGINQDGKRTILNTKGNPDGHIILRGGKGITNYDEESIKNTEGSLEKAGIKTGIMVDASHANSLKKHENQIIVSSVLAKQISTGNKQIMGIMIESNTCEGNQSFIPGKDDTSILKTGVSITDACVSIEQTQKMLEELNRAVEIRKKLNK